MNKNKIRIMSLLLLFSLVSLLNVNINKYFNSSDSFETDSLQLKTSSAPVNGKPLLVIQHANISNSFLPFSLPTNISFTLAQGWISKNITIDYEGVASENNTVSNGDFASDRNGWTYNSNNPGELKDLGHTASDGNPPGCVHMEIHNGA